MNGRASRLPAAAVLDPQLPADAVRVLGLLGIYADANGQCSPSLATMGTLVGLSRPWVQRQLKLLEDRGYVIAERQGRSEGPSWLTRYRLVYGPVTGRVAMPDTACKPSAASTEVDLVWRFLSACTEPGRRVKASDLYRAYAEWSRRNGPEPRSLTFFGRRLNDLEIPSVKDGFIFYTGLQLTDEVAGWLDELDGMGGLEGLTASKGDGLAGDGVRTVAEAAETLQPSQTVQCTTR